MEPQLNFLIDDKQHYCICQVSVVDCLCDGKIDIHRLASASRFQNEQNPQDILKNRHGDSVFEK